MAALSDRFLVQGLAGAGGMGTVFRALDRRTGARVAVKIVNAEGAGLAARLAVEAEALAALRHPAIVRFVGSGTGLNGRPFLVTEWLDGEDLAARLERGPLPARQVVELGRRVAQALGAAHAKDIVHRDIKPPNLLLPGGEIERVKVVDFGIARLRSARGLTPADAIVGTPGYMAPEQARGSGDVDARADLFSLGAVLFECLTGRPAFSGEHTMAVLAKLLIQEPPRIGELRPDTPPGLARLVDWMLAKDRADRPASAEVVADALGAIARAMDRGEAPSPDAPGAPRAPTALGGSEQRLVSVVAVRPPHGWLDPDAIGPEAETLAGAPAPPALRELRAAVEPLGARVEPLRDGSTLLTWMSADVPADQAARAARGALLAQKLAPDAVIALASGLSDVSRPHPVGQVLDRAARLLASPGGSGGAGIRLDEVAARLLDARFEVAQTSEGFELLREDDIGETARRLLGRPTPCFGRERELRMLSDLLDECAVESCARAVLVTGAAGIGKSRLRHELLRRLGPGVAVWQARGDPMAAGSTFGMLASALQWTAGVPGGAALAVRQERLQARVAQHVAPEDRDRVAAFLGEILGTPFPDEHLALLRSARRSAAAMVDQIRRAWIDFVAAECAAHPVVLALEDMHWGDASSVAIVDATLDRLRDRPLFVLALGRPETREVFPELWARRRVHDVQLHGLSARAASELVGHALGASAEPARVAELVERADGNAFYLEEMIRAVAEGRGGALPETVLAMVQARLDALTSDQRRVLRAASVFGDAFWPGGVAALLGGDDPGALDEWIDALVDVEILVWRDESRFPDEPELAFRHALLREGAHALLTEDDRALGHTLAAGWLERMGGADPSVLAGHLERGKMLERAAEYHLMAAERALSGGDIQAAIASAERARAVVEAPDPRLRCAKVLVEARWFGGDLERAGAHADEILALTTAGAEFSSALCVKLVLAAERGSPDRLAEAMQALASAEVTPETAELLVRAHSMVVVVLAMTGPRALAAHHLEQAERLAASVTLDAVSSWFLFTARGEHAFVFESSFVEARRSFCDALAAAELAGDPRWSAFSHALIGWVDNAIGDFEGSERELARAIATSHPTGLARLMGRIVLSWTHSMRGRLDEAEVQARAVIDEARSNGFGEGLARTALAYVLMRRGEMEAAARELHASLDLVEMTPVLRTIVTAAAAELAMERGRAREALAFAREALGLPDVWPIYPTSEPCARLAEIRALAALGDPAGAREALAAARASLSAQAAPIEGEAARERFLQKPPWNERIRSFTDDLVAREGEGPAPVAGEPGREIH